MTFSIRINNKFTLSVMLSVTIKPIMLSVNMLIVIMISVDMPNVVAPRNHISAAQSKKNNFSKILNSYSTNSHQSIDKSL
jgi:hypothetical protein